MVLVRVQFAGISSGDYLAMRGEGVRPRLPFVPGSEAAGEVVAVKVGTNDNTADILTKTLTGERHRTLAAQLRGRCWIQKLG